MTQPLERTSNSSPDPDALRQRLLQENLGLVHHVARQVARGLAVEVELDELVSAGTLGLMAALETFDVSRSLAFSTFAAPRIRGAILDELRRQAPMPRSVRRKSREVGAARHKAAAERGGPPTDRELAATMGVDVNTLWKWQLDMEGAIHVPLDQRESSDDAEYAPTDTLIGSDGTEVESRLTHEQEVEHLKTAMRDLTDQERTVLALHYYEELRLREIADILELTESRVSQIRTKALAKLRATMTPLRRDAR